MSIAANIGDVAILDFEACFPDSMVGLVPNHHTHLDFLYYLMCAMKSIMLRSAVLSTQLNLNYVRIGTNFAPFPPKDEQEKIAGFLDAKSAESHKTKAILNKQIETHRLPQVRMRHRPTADFGGGCTPGVSRFGVGSRVAGGGGGMSTKPIAEAFRKLSPHCGELTLAYLDDHAANGVVSRTGVRVHS